MFLATEVAEREEWSRTEHLLAALAEVTFELHRDLLAMAGVKDLPARLVIPRPGVEAVRQEPRPINSRPARTSRRHATHDEILAKFGRPRR